MQSMHRDAFRDGSCRLGQTPAPGFIPLVGDPDPVQGAQHHRKAIPGKHDTAAREWSRGTFHLFVSQGRSNWRSGIRFEKRDPQVSGDG